jgi:hypothetical protein
MGDQMKGKPLKDPKKGFLIGAAPFIGCIMFSVFRKELREEPWMYILYGAAALLFGGIGYVLTKKGKFAGQ